MSDTPISITVCAGSSCKALGSPQIIDALRKEIDTVGMDGIKVEAGVKRTGCHGFCEAGPIVVIKPENILYTQVKPEDAIDIINALKTGAVVDRLLFESSRPDAKKNPNTHVNDLDFYKYQTRYLLRRTGEIDPFDIDEYLARDGFKAIQKAVSEMTPEQVIETIQASGLRGRGGAGFPTGKKWQFLHDANGDEKYILANADEGDPGSFMDRTLLEGDPFSVIEGMLLAAYATGATKGYIYVRAEYPEAVSILRNALHLAKRRGFLGTHLFDKKDFNFDLDLFLGAGAFVCGEETALLESVEGRRGMPRFKPPFPAQAGLFLKPTNINNVKSYAYTTHIIREGVDSFRQYGTEQSPGTAVLSLTGKVKYTGIVEVPMGTSLNDLIHKIGGGSKSDTPIKAVLTGGPSGGAIPADKLDIGVDFESITKAGSIMGSGGVLVVDEEDSMVELADFFMQFCMAESCGKCVPCREGTLRMHEILKRIQDGKGKPEDLDLLDELGTYIKRNALCGLGQTAPNPALTTLKYYRQEYLDAIHKKKKVTYKITDKCVGCHLCAKKCPVQCISGNPKEKHVIDQSKCIHCGACYRVCPIKAIDKVIS